jgi:hypothetical protein
VTGAAVETMPMTAQQYEQAVTVLAALIARWAATAAAAGSVPGPTQRGDTGHPGPRAAIPRIQGRPLR